MRIFLLVVILLLGPLSYSQIDSSQVLAYVEFMEMVRQHHPSSMQSELQRKMGEAFVQAARGGFDPKLQADFAQKYFDDKEYYELGEGKLKVPTWFGIELEGGYERNEGTFLNPENNVPTAGLWFAGISVPIGEGLFIDERRAELRKAQIMIKQTDAQARIILNDLLLQAGSAYWEWFMAYQQYLIYQEAQLTAQIRFEAVKQGAFLGDRPMIDTLEAVIQLQNRELNLQQAELEFINSSAYLSIFLWQDGLIPLELAAGTVPSSRNEVIQNTKDANLPLQIDTFINQHPELLRTQAKFDQLEIDRRWAAEQLKPQLNLKYKPITEAIDNDPMAEYSINNYTWGLQFEFPLFLRKERGKLNLMKLKLNETNFKLETKRQLLNFKINASINEFNTTRSQIKLYTKTTDDYEGLFQGEQRLFDIGESSLFLVNSRELGFINAQLKLVELLAKNNKAILKTNYSLGILK